MKWKTKDGQILNIKDMTEQHIKNCIKMLERQLEIKPESWIDEEDSDGSFWAKMSEDRINNEIEENINNAISSLKYELYKRSDDYCPKCKGILTAVICRCEVNKFRFNI